MNSLIEENRLSEIGLAVIDEVNFRDCKFHSVFKFKMHYDWYIRSRVQFFLFNLGINLTIYNTFHTMASFSCGRGCFRMLSSNSEKNVLFRHYGYDIQKRLLGKI